MKKIIFTVVAAAALLTFNRCGNDTNLDKISILANNTFDPLIGAKHNAIVKEALAKANISKSNDYQTNLNNLNGYFSKVHDFDASGVPSQLFTSKRSDNMRTIDDFDPIAFIDKYQSNYSSAFAATLKQIIYDVQSVQGDSSIVKNVINQYIAKVQNGKVALSQGEANGLLNILTVMSSSTSLWYSQASTADERAQYKAQTDAWKIVAADGIEGLAGGLLGGPAGALVGLAAGSLNAWVSML